MGKDTKTTKISVLGQRLKNAQDKGNAKREHIVCPMAKIIKSLDDDTAKALYEVLNDDVTTTTDIVRELRASGIRIARQTVVDYRHKTCACAHEDKCGLQEQYSE